MVYQIFGTSEVQLWNNNSESALNQKEQEELITQRENDFKKNDNFKQQNNETT